MSQGMNLLKMLEPAVRPVAAPGAAKPAAGRQPFEAQSFDSLLASIDEGPSVDDPLAADAASFTTPASDFADFADFDPDAGLETPAAAAGPGPLAPLADLGRIENPGLRAMLAQRASLASA